MGGFGSVTWKEFDRFLLAYGCELKRIRGNHRIYTKSGLIRPLVIPQHDPLPAFVIMNNLRVLGATKETFFTFLGR